jgi:hypothetical protein
MIDNDRRTAMAVLLLALCAGAGRPADADDDGIPAAPTAPVSPSNGGSTAASAASAVAASAASPASQEAEADAQTDRMWEQANEQEARALKNALSRAHDCRSTPSSDDCRSSDVADQLRQEGDRCLHRIERRIARLERRSGETTQQTQTVSQGGCSDEERSRRQWSVVRDHGCVDSPPLLQSDDERHENPYRQFDGFQGHPVFCPATELDDLQLALAVVTGACEPERRQQVVAVQTARGQAASESLARARRYLNYATDRRNAMNGDDRLGPLSRILERITNSARTTGALPGNAHFCWKNPGPARSGH